MRTPGTVNWRNLLQRSPRPNKHLRPSVLPLSRLPASIRHYAAAPATAVELAHTRNIGIIAHIDAGKTTTTERMLYYSGFTRRIGDVDDGSTVMDYLPAERQRGITITSAAITFQWKPPHQPTHTINLIDTPGHADFTFEVERSIRVLDGAVTILDGVAGVEAQTEKVWKQAGKHFIPRIIFVNKLDRMGARFGATVREIAMKLNGWPAVVQLPVYETDDKGEDLLRGVVDIIERKVYLYQSGGDGSKIQLLDYQWLGKHHPKLLDEAVDARNALVELLSSHDDALVEEYLKLGDHEKIPSASIKRALRAATLSGTGEVIPVLCGASFRNVGVQPLMDAVVDYLPCPSERPPTPVSHGLSGQVRALMTFEDANRLCALAFKVVNDPKRGPMVYVRVYSGTLNNSATLWNTSLQVKERANRLLQMYANEAVDIPSIPTGHIGVILGLKETRTGDTLIDDSPAARAAEKAALRVVPKVKTPVPKVKKAAEPGIKVKQVVPIDYKTLRLKPIDIPPPVFFTALEAHSLSAQKQLDEALAILLREDPSLNVSTDPDSGQTLLSGMGELHLEIATDRLTKDLKAKADMGRILIAFRESLMEASPTISHTTYMPDGTSATVKAVINLLNNGDRRHVPRTPNIRMVDNNYVSLTLPGETTPLASSSNTDPTSSIAQIRAAMLSGATAALSRGPTYHLPLHDLGVLLQLLPSTPDTGPLSAAAISSAARVAVTQCLECVPSVIVEPVMRVVVSCDEASLGKVTQDIQGARGGTILALNASNPHPDVLLSEDRQKERHRKIEHDRFIEDEREMYRAAGMLRYFPYRTVAEMEVKLDLEDVWIPITGDTDYGYGTSGRANAMEARGTRGDNGKRMVLARMPLTECVGYLKGLRSLTGGRGTFVMELEGWERVQNNRMETVKKFM
ncbi:P-loop containing nucleoside triphosphate hydrolase protein [Ascodesmis nigricans]|uniref:Ribosome-releasing factor 2, mitochondrial n=1 Tax=Ascodesmis nigricans TaxID=341454 RepID=A0A4S2N258_9PEZI|nr:P-loop containing nucleoside triphosphate hydrolase protein [Ascodesmis nigricans]